MLVVHVTQEPAGKATIVWDDAFSTPEREPFVVAEMVNWSTIANVLNKIYAQSTSQGDENQRGLSQEALNFLASKAFQNNCLTNYDNEALSLQAFRKRNLPEGKFTFWEWYYATLKLILEHALVEWRENLIYGFISKEAAVNILMPCETGTFLLRFSDSVLGGLSVAWKAGNEVKMLKPFVASDLLAINLSRRILDLRQLHLLYPSFPKHLCFKEQQEKLRKAKVTGTRNSQYVDFIDTTILKS